MKAQATVRLNFVLRKTVASSSASAEARNRNFVYSPLKGHMTAEGQGLVLDFKAKDTSALRAAINSYLRLIGVAMDLQKFTDP